MDKASEHNERQSILLELGNKKEIGVVQIAGLIARRIVCDLKEGKKVTTGERFGIIRFGSRVDLYLPTSFDIKVLEGQRMIGGETVIGEFKDIKEMSLKNSVPKKSVSSKEEDDKNMPVNMAKAKVVRKKVSDNK